MTKQEIKYQILYLIKTFGCAKYYIYFEKPLTLLNGIKINEIRLHGNDNFTILTIYNGYVPTSKLKKDDLLLILEGIKDNI
jgi:hypothetical protein